MVHSHIDSLSQDCQSAEIVDEMDSCIARHHMHGHYKGFTTSARPASNFHNLLSLTCLVCIAAAAEQDGFVTDPKSSELLELAEPLVVDESKYGCGPLLEPGNTYYVSLQGDDEADGRSWGTAWRHVAYGASRLRAGDTLLIGEGEYSEEQIVLNASLKRYYPPARRDEPLVVQVGEPGRPIRIMAAPRQRVIITSAKKVGPFRRAAGCRYTYEAELDRLPSPHVSESDSLVRLQNAGSTDRVEGLPGTYAFDGAERKLYVRFSDTRAASHRTVYVYRVYATMRIHSSYVLVKGLWFKHAIGAGVLIRSNLNSRTYEHDPRSGLPRGGAHNTIEDCALFANWGSGVEVCVGARRNLIKDNYGCRNEYRGAIKFSGSRTADNLFIGNRLDPTVPTIRTRPVHYYFGINNYSGKEGFRNYIINNVINNRCSVRWKPAAPQTVFQGNVCVGSVSCYSSEDWITKPDRMVLRNNVICGKVYWNNERFGPGGAGGDWAATDKAFLSNFYAGGDPNAIEAARFADPAYVDYRLQSDSPLVGKALGGGDRGAFRHPSRGRVLYVGPKGSDASVGTSERLAFGTLAGAVERLRPGDTLYVMAADHADPLVVSVSGTSSSPVRIRAYHRQRIALPGVMIAASHVSIEGFVVRGSRRGGICVTGSGVRIDRCLVCRSAGPGVRGQAARNLTLNHCTIVGNESGVALEQGSPAATVRNCIVAHNAVAGVAIRHDSREGYRGYSNCYFGVGLDRERIAKEADSLIADPRFAGPKQDDYRLKWDSPAVFLGEFGRPAGSEPALLRRAAVTDIRVSNIQSDSATVHWCTPEDDTTGEIRFRAQGASEWESAYDPEQGTVHAAGMMGLAPETSYEFEIVAKIRRGRDGASPVKTFRTAAQSRAPTSLYLSPQGSDRADGRSPQTAWRSIRKACLEARPSDTVFVAPGVYRHAIAPIASGTPGRRVTFKRSGVGEVVIQGDGVIGPLVRLLEKSYVTVDGFSLYGPATEGNLPVIHLKKCKGVEILNCRTRRAGTYPSETVKIRSCSDVRIEGNVFSGARYHIWVAWSSNLLIKNNTLANHSVVSLQFYEWPENSKFINNLFYQAHGRGNPYIWYHVTAVFGLLSDHNLFTPCSNHEIARVVVVKDGVQSTKWRAKDLPEWQRLSGWDKHSLQAAPRFADAGKQDFRLRPDSPALGRGLAGENIGAQGVAE